MFKALRDHTGKFHYLGIGRYSDFLPYLSFRHPWQNIADKVFLLLQSVFEIKTAPENFSCLQAVKVLRNESNLSWNSALFFDQDIHGVASVAGFVSIDHTAHFVKIFKNTEDVIFQKFQADFVATYFNGPFLTMAVTRATSFALFFQFSKRYRSIGDDDHIERKLLHVTEKLLQHHALQKTVREMIPLDLGAVLAKAGLQDMQGLILEWSAKNTALVDVIPVHGDMTKLNLFVNKDEKHVIVNYERAGWHVAYYDFLHYALDRRVHIRHAGALQDLRFGINYMHFDTAITLYLIDQIYHELSGNPTYGTEDGISVSLQNRLHWLREKLAA